MKRKIEISKGEDILNAEGLVCGNIENLSQGEYHHNQMFWLPEYTRGVSLKGHTGGKILKLTKVSDKSVWWKELVWVNVGEYTWSNTYSYDITKFQNEEWRHYKKEVNGEKPKKLTDKERRKAERNIKAQEKANKNTHSNN